MVFWEKIGWRYWMLAVIVGIGLPIVSTLIGLSPVWRFGGLLLLINGGLAIGLGRRIYQHAQPGWWLLIWPLTYLVGAIGWLPQYTWYLAIVYLCLSYVSYGLAQTHKQIRS
ncbi:hypothetical protein DIS17_11060 [Levilactobacillus brevis]|uniref:Integral membrane protein n=1 Tax=Levilactobacillus brevis TaxID=1580 RepID=A0AAJ5FGK6_LEVBR|nr:hypothetical protein [Levilactobacillus brevis]AWP46696.1 hypothetical protein CCS05_07095 [Levilactobacillus brevis]RAY10033.1 hypothetical protein DN391_03230 [Levilactobacillus brevis]TOZ02409.1 hypothetical protein DIS17_11060 [Levilactobacillus brevis]